MIVKMRCFTLVAYCNGCLTPLYLACSDLLACLTLKILSAFIVLKWQEISERHDPPSPVAKVISPWLINQECKITAMIIILESTLRKRDLSFCGTTNIIKS